MSKSFIERKDNAVLDSIELQNQGYENIHFQGFHLTGGIESSKPYNEYFFGELDSKDNNIGLDISKPIYHFSPKDDEYNLGTLKIFLDSNILTILNYSLLDSSLNIKLDLTNKESKNKQHKAKDKNKQQQSKEQDKPLSIAKLHPILEDDEIKCPHNGVVKLKANIGKSFKSQGIPMVLESDLLNSQIIGCSNNIAGIPSPCTAVSTILPSARALKKYNNDYPIMQDLISSGVFSNKGFPLICTPKANSFKIDSPNPSTTSEMDKEALKANINPSIPTLHIITHYKDLEEFYFTANIYENKDKDAQSGFYKPNQTLNIKLPKFTKDRDYMDLDSNEILGDIFSQLSGIYNPRLFAYRILTIRIAYSIYEYILIIPKTMPKFIYNALKDRRSKDELDLGYGDFMDLQRGYVRSMKDSVLDITGAIILAPSGCERLYIKVA